MKQENKRGRERETGRGKGRRRGREREGATKKKYVHFYASHGLAAGGAP